MGTMAALSIQDITSRECFAGSVGAPLQLVRVLLGGAVTEAPVLVQISGEASGELLVQGPAVLCEVPVSTSAGVGSRVPIMVRVGVEDQSATAAGWLTVAEPGWTMHMVSHFHYDPVWWNTQAGYTSEWDRYPMAQPWRSAVSQHGFALVKAHMATALRDPLYRFVLAEADYLKPYWDMFPQDRQVLRQLMAEGRLEIMGGAYNEPNTNLTSPETTIRNAVYGAGFQRDILGADPRTAWQLDVFGHDPQFPGIMADAGLTSSSWARGPFHQWGPNMGHGTYQDVRTSVAGMQFPSEFEWISPGGGGLVTSYMAGHYGAGWSLEAATSLEEACEEAYRLFTMLKDAAATRNVLLPVGGDYTPPNRWVTAIEREWNSRYVWPRFVCSTPGLFFSAVSESLSETGKTLSPQTRDMNPVYTGKDVSYIDTKQANRAAENVLLDAEKFATLAHIVGGFDYPAAEFDLAWRQLLFGAHHDGITGSESDQVYIDLLAGWREAWELASRKLDRSLANLESMIDTAGVGSGLRASVSGEAVTVFNSLSFLRSEWVTIPVGRPARIADADGSLLPAFFDAGTLSFFARDVPSLGYRSFWLLPLSGAADPADPEPDAVRVAGASIPGAAAVLDTQGHATPGIAVQAGDGWESMEGMTISNSRFRLTVDDNQGGCVCELVDLVMGVSLIPPGGLGNELLLYPEYPEHPEFHEGPWHLLPKGEVLSAAARPAISCSAQRSSVGEQIVVEGVLGTLHYVQTLLLRVNSAIVECRTDIPSFDGSDQLLRVRWNCPIPGALPVAEVGDAVIGRSVAYPDSDTAVAPWTLDNPAYRWFGQSSAVRIVVHDPGESTPATGEQGALGEAHPGKARVECAVGVAEIVLPSANDYAKLGRPLAVALVRCGVTSTCSTADGSRYGNLDFDSNVPDTRIVVGMPNDNEMVGQLLQESDVTVRQEWERQLQEQGCARLLLTPSGGREREWRPNVDVSGRNALPVLLLGSTDGNASAVEALCEDLEDASISVGQPRTICAPLAYEGRSVGIVNRGTPGFAVDAEGSMYLSLLRSCTGWPSGVWINPPVRTVPDGSAFQLQHWPHTFEYALVSGTGDWREASFVRLAAAYNHPLAAVRASIHGGPLPPQRSFLEVQPDAAVLLSALKLAGNPYSRGNHAEKAGCKVAVRLYESLGNRQKVLLRPGFPIEGAATANLLEEGKVDLHLSNEGVVLETGPCEIATVLLETTMPSWALQDGPAEKRGEDGAGDGPLPLFSRYWLHNRGAAPMGNQPVTVSVEGTGTGTFLVTVCSDVTDAALDFLVHVDPPEGWDADPLERSIHLPPGGWSSFSVQVTPPAQQQPAQDDGGAANCYLLAATCKVDGQPFPGSLGQDIALLDQWGTAIAPALLDNLLAVTIPALPSGLAMVPGEPANLELLLENTAHFAIRGEVALVSPWGTWQFTSSSAQHFEVMGKSVAPVQTSLLAPHGTVPGSYWCMFKVMWFGRIAYSPAVQLQVLPPGGV